MMHNIAIINFMDPEQELINKIKKAFNNNYFKIFLNAILTQTAYLSLNRHKPLTTVVP